MKSDKGDKKRNRNYNERTRIYWGQNIIVKIQKELSETNKRPMKF